MSKTRSDSKLGNLKEAQKEAIYQWCKELSLKEAVKKIHAEFGISTSSRALSEFFALRELTEEFDQADAEARAQEELMLSFDPKDAERAKAWGDYIFNQRAIRGKDVKAFVGLGLLGEEKRKNDVREADIKLRRERFQFDAAAAALKHLPNLRKIASDKQLDDRSRVNAARQLLFGVTPE